MIATEAGRAFPGARIAIETGSLDPRLQLPPCRDRLEAFRNLDTPPLGKTTVGVRCPSGAGWTVYVQSTVSVFTPVVVLNHPLKRGTLVAPDDIRTEERNLATLAAGYLLAPERAIGMEVKRNLSAGAVLTMGALASPRLVQRGQAVTLIVRGEAVTVRVAGESLDDGVAGSRVRVRNSSSRQVVEGLVEGPATVRVVM